MGVSARDRYFEAFNRLYDDAGRPAPGAIARRTESLWRPRKQGSRKFDHTIAEWLPPAQRLPREWEDVEMVIDDLYARARQLHGPEFRSRDAIDWKTLWGAADKMRFHRDSTGKPASAPIRTSDFGAQLVIGAIPGRPAGVFVERVEVNRPGSGGDSGSGHLG